VITTLVIDASIAVKWVVEEDGTAEALALREHTLIAPDLLLVEAANVLRKKVQRRELSADEAVVTARLLQAVDVELVATRSLMEKTVRLAIELARPAYDCLYLALALQRGCRLVTADTSLLRKLTATKSARMRNVAIPLVSREPGTA